MKNGKYETTTLCGSTKFKEEFYKAAASLAYMGHVILMPEHFHHADGINMSDEMMKQHVDMHFQKIDMSDSIYVICPGQYIGESTMNEILYAARKGVSIGFSNTPKQEVLDAIENEIEKN